MITGRWLKYITVLLMCGAVALAVCVTYFPEVLNIRAGATMVDMSYATELFAGDQVMTVDVLVDEDKWQEMLDNAINEEYIRCDVVINGVTYKDVGIRPKGNTSLTSIVNDSTTDRYSFKIEFDHYISGQTCMGLDKLVLNNNYQDTTSMKEYLSYEMMSYMGVASPLHSYASISVNGESWGFYLALEAYEKSFAMRNYGTTYGQLYKPESAMGGMGSIGGAGGGTDLVYTGDEISSYSSIFDAAVFNPTDKEKQAVITALENLSKGIDLETYIDVEATLRYCAVNTFLVNLDSYFGTLQHNYYLYEKNGQLTMLPWDYNLAFSGFQMNSGTDAVNLAIDTPVQGTTLEQRPMIGQLLAVDEYKELYHQYLDELITGYIDSGLYLETIEKIDTLIADYVTADPSAFYTYEEYQTGVENIKLFGQLRAQSVAGQLAGTIPATTEEQVANSESLVDGSSVNITAMGTQGGSMGFTRDTQNDGSRGQDNRDGGEFPGDGEIPEMGGFSGDGEVPEMGGFAGDGEVPEMGGFPGGGEIPEMNGFPEDGEMPEGNIETRRGGFGQGQDNGQRAFPGLSTSSVSGTYQTVTLKQIFYLALSAGGVLLGLLFVIFYKRRKYRA